MIGGLRKLPKVEFCGMYLSPNVIKSDKIMEGEMIRTCNMCRGGEGGKTILVGKTEGKRRL